ncbi:MAG: hypothetical protein RIB59_13325, partial [Rhodospirillales bacterium]
MPEFFKAKTGIATPFFGHGLTALKDRLLQGPYGTPKQFAEDEKSIPVGLIVGYEGMIASIPKGWALCDGTNGTPDLTDHMVIGVDGSTYNLNDTGGSSTQVISPTGSVSGTHTGGGLGYGSGGGASWNESRSSSHTWSCTIDNRPDYRTQLFIMAIKAMKKLPINAALFWNDNVTDIPKNFIEFVNAQGRFYKGVNSDTRNNINGNTQNITITSSSAGAHIHTTGSGGIFTASGAQNPDGNAIGNHSHNSSVLLTVEPPPYHVLVGIWCVEDAAPRAKMIAMYFGDLNLLVKNWQESNGTNGSPDLRGRFVMTEDRTIYNKDDTGGAVNRGVSGTSVASSWVHDHTLSGTGGTLTAAHTNMAVSHSHTLSGGSIALPKYRS